MKRVLTLLFFLSSPLAAQDSRDTVLSRRIRVECDSLAGWRVGQQPQWYKRQISGCRANTDSLKLPHTVAPPTNRPPVASIAGPTSCVVGAICTWTSTSTDDKAVVSQAWDCSVIPNCASTGLTASAMYPHAGETRNILLTVRDAEGLQSTKTYPVTIVAPVVTPPPVDSSPVVIPPPVTPPSDTGTLAQRAELPRSVPNPQFAKALRTITVTAGTITGDLQAALNASLPGDSLVLSGTFTGNFTLPVRQCGAGISIVGSARMPIAGTRVDTLTARGYPKIVTTNSAPALKTLNPTCGWRLAGVEVAASAAAGVPPTATNPGSLNYGIVWLGDGGWTGGGETQVSLATTPRDFLLDRVYIHGAPTTNSTRCVFLNSASTVIRDSYIADCHAVGFDSQAILGCNGAGPYLIENNDLQGATENVMFGGCDPVTAEMIPSDITIRRNYIHKLESWKGLWSIKNLFELKNARRVLVEANVLEHSWVASQVGMAIVIKSSTENCAACTWEGTKDVTVRYNVFRYAHRGLNIQAIDGSSAGTTASHTERVTVENNLFDQIGTSNGIQPSDGWLMLLTHDVKDAIIRNNTFISNTPGYGLASYFTYSGGAARRIEIVDNIYAGESYYALASDGGNHTQALTAFAGTSWRFQGNVVAQVDQQFWASNPPNNSYLTSVTALGLLPSGSLPTGSPYTGKGADVAGVLQKTAGVVVP